jgi:hypothetical protein
MKYLFLDFKQPTINQSYTEQGRQTKNLLVYNRIVTIRVTNIATRTPESLLITHIYVNVSMLNAPYDYINFTLT